MTTSFDPRAVALLRNGNSHVAAGRYLEALPCYEQALKLEPQLAEAWISLGGALVVGLTWAVLGGGWRGLPVALLAGLGGSLADSLLGATVQALYRCPICGALTEAEVHRPCGQRTDLARGHRWITNDAVNALSTLAGALLGAAIWRRGQTTERGGARQGRG